MCLLLVCIAHLEWWACHLSYRGRIVSFRKAITGPEDPSGQSTLVVEIVGCIPLLGSSLQGPEGEDLSEQSHIPQDRRADFCNPFDEHIAVLQAYMANRMCGH